MELRIRQTGFAHERSETVDESKVIGRADLGTNRHFCAYPEARPCQRYRNVNSLVHTLKRVGVVKDDGQSRPLFNDGETCPAEVLANAVFGHERGKQF